MRLRDISPEHRRLLAQLASGISGRLEADFVDLPGGDDANVGVALREGTRNVVIELPIALLAHAAEDRVERERLRTRMKARRDRMMVKTPPAPLPQNIPPMFSAGPPRGGFRGGRR